MGGLDGKVAVVMGGAQRPTHELPRAEWDRVMAVNATAVFLRTKHAIPHLHATGGGSIVNISSVYGIVGGGYTAR